MKCIKNSYEATRLQNNEGFSLIELLIVMLVISILAVLSLIAVSGKNIYFADHQAYLFTDILKEARQMAISQKETMRVEISRDERLIRLINENEPGDARDDELVKSVALSDEKEVVFHTSPNNLDEVPEESAPTPLAKFKRSNHPISENERVATLRFLKNGNVTNAGSNAIGDGSSVGGTTIYFWSPRIADDGTVLNQGVVLRAVTVSGNSGRITYWKCQIENSRCAEWVK